MSAFRPFLEMAAAGAPLGAADMRAAILLLLEGAASDVEAAGFLMALKARGETIDEIAAAATAMREKALRVAAPPEAIDTCGTGGDGAGTFNISTAVALVAAGAGAKVAKHGNRAATSKSGSAEALEALGVDLGAEPETMARAVREAGVGFLHAARHHRAMANLAGVRRALGVRTMFNLLGPLSNPAGTRRQLVGVYAPELVEKMAGALGRLGAERAWVFHGDGGLDELSTTGPSRVAELRDGAIRMFEVAPEDAGLPRARLDDLRGGDPTVNAAAIRALLAGERSAYRDIVVLNAAAALIVAGIADGLIDGAQRAAAAIDDGRAAEALRRLVAISNGRAP